MKKIPIAIETLNFQKGDGLIPAVIQDQATGVVLMVGYQNQAAVEKTLKIGQVTFWSRTKQRLWTKGETSGNGLEWLDIKLDCDQDALLYLVKAPAATCHRGDWSCFGEGASFDALEELFQLIQDRKKYPAKDSYTTSLFAAGLDRIAQKVGEEAVEVVIAAKNKDQEAFLNESADLLFHFLVLCAEKGAGWSAVLEVLRSRSK